MALLYVICYESTWHYLFKWYNPYLALDPLWIICTAYPKEDFTSNPLSMNIFSPWDKVSRKGCWPNHYPPVHRTNRFAQLHQWISLAVDCWTSCTGQLISSRLLATEIVNSHRRRVAIWIGRFVYCLSELTRMKTFVAVSLPQREREREQSRTLRQQTAQMMAVCHLFITNCFTSYFHVHRDRCESMQTIQKTGRTFLRSFKRAAVVG